MVNLVCWVYSEQELTLRAIEVIKNIKEENGYDNVKFLDVNVHGKPSNGKVLVFGSRAPSADGRATFQAARPRRPTK